MLQDRGAMLMGIGIGAGLMYFLDPTGGGRRRALVRDQIIHASHYAEEAAQATRRDLTNRATGVAARLRGATRREPPDDRVLIERVRAQLGRVVSHPHAIDVDAIDGVVTLRGPILMREVAPLCRAVSRIRGVGEVIDQLDAHDTAENIPALQGEGSSAGGMRREWSPTARMMTAMVATAGVGLLARATAARH
jgi:hypothetical protein